MSEGRGAGAILVFLFGLIFGIALGAMMIDVHCEEEDEVEEEKPA